MGLEHLGVVVGEDIDEFSRVHRAALTGQQFQSPSVEPVYVLFEDFTHVKCYRRSLCDGVILEGARFDGFSHVDDWVPQRVVTATGPNPLPRRPRLLLAYKATSLGQCSRMTAREAEKLGRKARSGHVLRAPR